MTMAILRRCPLLNAVPQKPAWRVVIVLNAVVGAVLALLHGAGCRNSSRATTWKTKAWMAGYYLE